MRNRFEAIIDAHFDFPFCLGFDPSYEFLNTLNISNITSKEKTLETLRAYNASLLSVAKKKNMIIKPQSAYYESWGMVGIISLFELIINANHIGLPIILDVKRSDIGSTMEAYKAAYLYNEKTLQYRIKEEFPNAITINPFMGLDTIESFKTDGGVFFLLRTSNPTSDIIQSAITQNGNRIYDYISDEIFEMNQNTLNNNGYGNFGAVIGATKPEDVIDIRKKLSNTIFLVPGFGAQGGDENQIKNFFINKDSRLSGAIINLGRKVINQQASTWKEYEDTVLLELDLFTNKLLKKLEE